MQHETSSQQPTIPTLARLGPVFGTVIGASGTVAGIGALIWLSVLGHFWLALAGFEMALLATWLIGVALIPGMFLMALAVDAQKRGASTGKIVLLSIPYQLYTIGIV